MLNGGNRAILKAISAMQTVFLMYNARGALFNSPLRADTDTFSTTNTCCTEITSDDIKAVCADGKEIFLPADRVILAAGMKSNSKLAHSFYGLVPETYIIGDCNRVGEVKEATPDGFLFAANIE